MAEIDIAPGVAPGDLLHAEAGDLLGGDELHLPHGGDGLELALGEDPVLPGVHHRQAQLALALEAAGIEAEVQPVPQGLGAGGVQRDRPALLDDLAVADVGVADQGAGLDLLHHGPPGGAAHQEQQTGVGERHPRSW